MADIVSSLNRAVLRRTVSLARHSDGNCWSFCCLFFFQILENKVLMRLKRIYVFEKKNYHHNLIYIYVSTHKKVTHTSTSCRERHADAYLHAQAPSRAQKCGEGGSFSSSWCLEINARFGAGTYRTHKIEPSTTEQLPRGVSSSNKLHSVQSNMVGNSDVTTFP